MKQGSSRINSLFITYLVFPPSDNHPLRNLFMFVCCYLCERMCAVHKHMSLNRTPATFMPRRYLHFCPCTSSAAGLSVTLKGAWRSQHFHNHFPLRTYRRLLPFSTHPLRPCEDSISPPPLPRQAHECQRYHYTSNCNHELVRNSCVPALRDKAVKLFFIHCKVQIIRWTLEKKGSHTVYC